MSAGRLASPMKSTYRGYRDQFDGTIPSRVAGPSNKDALIVFTRINLRKEDCTDMLEALGLIPTVENPESRGVPTTCADCAWESTKPKNPKMALATHRRAKHMGVPA